jgi:hypothetical protein
VGLCPWLLLPQHCPTLLSCAVLSTAVHCLPMDMASRCEAVCHMSPSQVPGSPCWHTPSCGACCCRMCVALVGSVRVVAVAPCCGTGLAWPLVLAKLVLPWVRVCPCRQGKRECCGAWSKARCHWLSGQVLTNPALRLCSPLVLCVPPAAGLWFLRVVVGVQSRSGFVWEGVVQSYSLLIVILVRAALHVC